MYSKKFRLPIKPGRRADRPVAVFSSLRFRVKVFNGSAENNRYAVVISKSVCRRSTERNFWRRRIADEVKNWPNVKKDFLLIVSPKIKGASANEARQELKKAGEKIKARCKTANTRE